MFVHRYRPDLAAILLVALATFVITLISLRGWAGPAHTLTNDLYVPAAMWASGAGWVNPPPEEVPGLRAFLDFQSDGFSVPNGPLPAFSRVEWDAFQQYHVYLVGLVGLTWRILGVSWSAVTLVIALLVTAAMLCVYGLFRLVAGRVASTAGACATLLTPALLQYTYNLRDVSKVPWLIAGMLVAGWLLRRPRAPHALWIAAVLFGLVTGVGLGFRRDLLMALPAGLLVLALCEGNRVRPWQRGVAALLLLGSFVLSAAPVLQAFQRHGSLGAHDTLMGMATLHDAMMGVAPAAYERIPVRRDLAIWAATAAWDTGFAPEQGPLRTYDEPEKRAFLLETLRMFPGDIILRGYAAMLTSLRGLGYRVSDDTGVVRLDPAGGVHGLWARSGIPLAVALGVFVVLAGRRPRTALVLAVLVLYYGAYPSMQFDARHVLHLAWLPLLPGAWACSRTFRLARYRRPAPGLPGPREGVIEWRGRRAVAVVTVLIAALLLPLSIARVVQARTLAPLVEVYATAPAIAIDAAPEEVGDWVVFRPAASEVFVAPPLNPVGSFRASVLVITLHDPPRDAVVWVQYAAPDLGGDFTRAYFPTQARRLSTGQVRLFVPVYSHHAGGFWYRFDAVALPKAQLASLVGIARVDPPEPGLYPWVVAQHDDAVAPFQRLSRLAWPPAYPVVEPPEWPRPLHSRAIEDSTSIDIERWRAHLIANPDDTFAGYTVAEALSRLPSADPVAFWRSVVHMRSDHAAGHYWLGRALHEAGSHSEASDRFRMALTLAPDDPSAYVALGTLLERGDDWEGLLDLIGATALPPGMGTRAMAWALRAETGAGWSVERRLAHWQRYTEAFPGQALGWSRLGMAYRDAGHLAAAGSAFETALRESHPRDAELRRVIGSYVDSLPEAP